MFDRLADELLQKRCPDFRLEGVLARSGKSLLATGTYQGAPATAKLLTDPAPLWRRRFIAELHAYQVFAANPPPVRVPRLLAGEAESGLLVLERVAGRSLATERHPPDPLPASERDLVLSMADAIAGWSPPAGAFEVVFDYPERVERYGPNGYRLLAARDTHHLRSLLAALQDQGMKGVVDTSRANRSARPSGWSFAHGDLLLGNFLVLAAPTGGNGLGAPGDVGGCVLVDWEWAGLYAPGYDDALLWTILGSDPGARVQLRDRARAGGLHREAAFWVNASMTITREIRIHRELPVGVVPDRDRRVAQLTVDLDLARHELARLTSACGPGA